MKAGDHLVLGADRVKPAQVLHAAYNDSEGITAEFNLNLLRVLNRELDADFRLERFDIIIAIKRTRPTTPILETQW